MAGPASFLVLRSQTTVVPVLEQEQRIDATCAGRHTNLVVAEQPGITSCRTGMTSSLDSELTRTMGPEDGPRAQPGGKRALAGSWHDKIME